MFHLHDAFEWFEIAVRNKVKVFGRKLLQLVAFFVMASEYTNLVLLTHADDVDQISLAPKLLITSTYYIWGPFLQTFVAGIRNNNYPQDVLYYGLREVRECIHTFSLKATIKFNMFF